MWGRDTLLINSTVIHKMAIGESPSNAWNAKYSRTSEEASGTTCNVTNENVPRIYRQPAN